ncbi:MAG: PLP-dependent aminotransferase family protein [Chloroflexota bacterium]
MTTSWDQVCAQRTRKMTSSAIREILKLTEQPDVVSFAGGLPAPDVFPVQAFADACQRVLHEHGPQALQYGVTEGYVPLREMICRFTHRSGLNVVAENVLITSGSQQALDLLGKILIDPGDRILVESPTYLGALQAWTPYGAEYITVPTDKDGMVIDALEAALQQRPKFIYAIPNFHNPLGVTLTLERRRKLVELAERYSIPIVEDDPYGQLRYEGQPLPSLLALDGEMRGSGTPGYDGNVVYLSTFSKTLAPGLRLAWVTAPVPLIRKLVQAKQGADLHTPTFNQMVAYEVGRGGFLDRHVHLIRKVYKERRDVMLAALDTSFPHQMDWTHPQGGLFLWAVAPQGVDTTEVLKRAVAEKVAFVPGESFHPDGGGKNTMRLNFSNASPEDIRNGIMRLGKVLTAGLKQA